MNRITTTPGSIAHQAGGRIMSPVVFAQRNLANGHEITSLRPTRGAPDLIQNRSLLNEYRVGTFPGGPTRGGRLTNIVYKVPISGADDRPEDHIIVGVAHIAPACGVDYTFKDVGILASFTPGFDPIRHDPKGPSWPRLGLDDYAAFDAPFVAEMRAGMVGPVPSLNATHGDLQNASVEVINGVGPAFAKRLAAAGYENLNQLARGAHAGSLDLAGIPANVQRKVLTAARALIRASDWQ